MSIIYFYNQSEIMTLRHTEIGAILHCLVMLMVTIISTKAKPTDNTDYILNHILESIEEAILRYHSGKLPC